MSVRNTFKNDVMLERDDVYFIQDGDGEIIPEEIFFEDGDTMPHASNTSCPCDPYLEKNKFGKYTLFHRPYDPDDPRHADVDEVIAKGSDGLSEEDLE